MWHFRVSKQTIEGFKNTVYFSEIRTSPHVFVLPWIQVRLFWIIWNKEDASGLFLRFYGKYYFQKAVFVNLSRRVCIIFRLNFKTFFWRYMVSLYLPLRSFYRFSQATINMICTFGSWPQNYFTTYVLLFQVCGSVFPRNLFRSLLVLARCLWSLFLTFAIFMKLLPMIGCIHGIDVG